MGKRKSNRSSPTKSSKHEKMLQPKVYIVDTLDFKNLVQQLTGNGKYPAAAWEAPLVETYHNNLDSTSASVEASPGLEIYKGLEAMLMEMDSDSCDDYDIASNYHQMLQQDHQHQAASLYEYDYGLPNISGLV
ncbi:hypothetical protein AAHA92_05367 [Salvia divinorum]|uniref:VQ domain-containing protein n=1 Tax=Salvia divinorum TaxID=28513 RepID=A0ABD1I277_SALDI